MNGIGQQQAQPAPSATAPQPQPGSSQSSNPQPPNPTISVADFFGSATADRKPSADTKVDEQTGVRVVVPVPGSAIEEKPRMDDAEAAKQAAVLMDMRETAQALGLCYAADGDVDDWERYKYEPWAKRLLVEAWQPIVQDANLRVNKWIRVLYTEGIATTPLIMLTMKARNLRLKNEELMRQNWQMQVQMAAAQYAQGGSIPVPPPMQQQAAQPAAAPKWNRYDFDSKRKWGVDNKGFFLEGQGGYIPEEQRREKPELTPRAIELLIKHNGEERVKRIFKI